MSSMDRRKRRGSLSTSSTSTSTSTTIIDENDDLAIVKAAAWAWYQRGSGSEGKSMRESDTASCRIHRPPPKPSRYRIEAEAGMLSRNKEDALSQTPCDHSLLGPSKSSKYKIETEAEALSQTPCDQSLLGPSKSSKYKIQTEAEAEAEAEAEIEIQSKTKEDALSQTPCDHPLLDIYEIERITAQLDLLIETSHAKRIVAKEKKKKKKKKVKGFWFGHASGCGSTSWEDVVDATTSRRVFGSDRKRPPEKRGPAVVRQA